MKKQNRIIQRSKTIKGRKNPYRDDFDIDTLDFKIGYLYALIGELLFLKQFPISGRIFGFGNLGLTKDNKFNEGYILGRDDAFKQNKLISRTQIDDYRNNLILEIRELVNIRKMKFPNASQFLINGKPIRQIYGIEL